MLHSIFTGIGSSIELTSLLVCIGCSIFLGVIIAFTYRSTGKYSKNFLITLSMLPLLVEAVIVMVNGNLGTSVAILGAFSLVKFRSLPGTSKEILCVDTYGDGRKLAAIKLDKLDSFIESVIAVETNENENVIGLCKIVVDEYLPIVI